MLTLKVAQPYGSMLTFVSSSGSYVRFMRMQFDAATTSSSQFSAGVNRPSSFGSNFFMYAAVRSHTKPLPPPMLPILNGRTIGTRTCGFSSPRFSLR